MFVTMQGSILVVALTLAIMPMMAHSAASESAMGDVDQSEACGEPLSKKGESAFLQVTARSQKASLPESSLTAQRVFAKPLLDSNKTGVNPSGAAAPLDEVGYSAVQDRCCQAEMKQFIERTAYQLGFQVCVHGGLTGMVKYHSCADPQNFAKLVADLMEDSADRCTWLGVIGNCLPVPEDCPDFPDAPDKPDCGCSRGDAAKVDFTTATVSENNLGGQGPLTGAEEIRYSRIGTTKSGDVFDVVVTTLGPYERMQRSDTNGISGQFGAINVAPSNASSDYTGASDFKFSFMAPGTNTPVVVEEIHMALFDLDKGSDACTEFTTSKGYTGYVTDIFPSVIASRLADGRTKFGAVIKSLPNPTTPNALTVQQRQNSVMYFYNQVSSFELTFGTEGAVANAGRNLFFAFESQLNDRCGP